MVRVRLVSMKDRQEFYGWTEGFPSKGTSFSMNLQLDNGTFSTREVTEVFDMTTDACKFIAKCGSYEFEVLSKEPENLVAS